jgi:uncharacterized protein YjbJ (UPF0337 family)
MDENRATGTAKNVGGKIEEGFGRVTGSDQTQLKGQARQVAGAAEDLYGRGKDAAASFTDVVQRTIEQQPYTSVAVAVAVGSLLGRTHRPLYPPTPSARLGSRFRNPND